MLYLPCRFINFVSFVALFMYLTNIYEPMLCAIVWVLKKSIFALDAVAQLVGGSSCNQKVAGLTPRLGTYRRQPIDASLSHRCFSLPSSLSLSLSLSLKKQ